MWSQVGALLSLIADEDTCVGFLLGGIGEINERRQSNFMVVDRYTPVPDIEDCFNRFIKRDDIQIILIAQDIANKIRPTIAEHKRPIPAVLEIPSKGNPYDAATDSILTRAKGMFDPSHMVLLEK